MTRYLFNGIRFRLTLVYSTLFGLFICAFAYIITNQYLQDGRADFDHGLFNYAIDLSEHLEVDHAGLKINFTLPASEDRKAFPFMLQETYYFVRSIDGKIISRGDEKSPFDEIPFDPTLPRKEDYTHRFFTFNSNDLHYRAVNLKITNRSGKKEMILQVATPSDALEDQERRHLVMTSLMVPILILISSFASYLIAGNALTPIKSLTDTANNIAAKNLSLRVPEVNTGDEVAELSKTLNNLLERLEKSFKAQEHFVSNASHQLNTPLAIIKGELDVLESKPRNIEDYVRFQKSLREEISRLIELVANMLLVSRVESGLENFIFNPQRIDDLLLTTSSRLAYKSREKKVTVRFNISEDIPPESLTVMGEKQLLDSLFENILDNAIKYTPENSTIQIDIKIVNGKLEVWIQDEGPGILGDFEEFLTKRFHRGPGISIPGTGIGLPIANRIAGYHNAQILYERPGQRGSRFIVRFN
ncbi:ATP-binding protein [Peredibacter starrii]|uniref:histidine kinase n=1 Tax=Peredibacter starrii TaxID=28202 RepID=A0AAX4HK61_9BACT|nr:ATP-binding protein [Peredibacter starrii]WPU63622.1 ATP-binding protein [Peredibacter starrii]